MVVQRVQKLQLLFLARKKIERRYYIMQKKIKIFLLAIIAIILCVPAQAQDYLSIEEAIDIILDYHNIETDITGIADYLTIDAENAVMTREIAVTAIIRSYGVYPVDEPDYVWEDEEEQDIQYRPYIDYARRIGITNGVKDNYFLPNRLITKQELDTMLQRASNIEIEPVYKMIYVDPIYKSLSADYQYGLSLCPDYLVDRFYKEGKTITVSTDPITLPDGSNLSNRYAGYIYYNRGIWLIALDNGEPYNYQDETLVHEIGHFLCYKTKSINRKSVPDELDWLIHRYRQYCDENNAEFFADSFVAYIFWNEEMKENMPITYQHIANCLKMMETN